MKYIRVVNKIPIKNFSFLFFFYSSFLLKSNEIGKFSWNVFPPIHFVALVNIRVSIAASLAQMCRSRNAIRNHRLAVKWLFVMVHKQLYQFIQQAWVEHFQCFNSDIYWSSHVISSSNRKLMSFIGIIDCFELILVLQYAY